MVISILSLIAGIGLGLIISGVTMNKVRQKKEKKPEFIKDYTKPQEQDYFSKDDIPRSIIDYYKKNK
jgi:uncharacterized membrane-anchored protein YhcB (DUF1043 family)